VPVRLEVGAPRGAGRALARGEPTRGKIALTVLADKVRGLV
jgi:hypothetical protein